MTGPLTLKYEKKPDFWALLLNLEQETKLRMEVDPKLKEHEPRLPGIQKKGAPAFFVMTMLAKIDLLEGRWEKVEGGYRLTAKKSLHEKPAPKGKLEDRRVEKKPTPMRNAAEEAKAKASKAAADFAKYHPLWLDPKLRAPLTLVEKTPKLPSLLEGLRACTGLDFTLADNLTYHDPVIGHFQSKHTFAYTIMEIIAKRELDNGRWEKTDTGYRLEGTSQALKPPPPGFPWLRVGLGLLPMVVIAGMIVWWERRRKKPAPGA